MGKNIKKILIVSALAIVGASVQAQSFVDGFDAVTFTSNGSTSATSSNAGNFGGDTINSVVTWAALNNSVGGPGLTGWFNTSAGLSPVFTSHAGAGQLNANFNSSTAANTIDSYAMSPVRTFNNGDVISFWTRTSSGTFADRLILKLSLAGSSTAVSSFTQTLVTVSPNLATGTAYPNVYTQFTTTLSGLAAPTSGRFAFNYNVTNAGPSGANSDFIGIDSVSYSAVPEPATMSALVLGAAAMLRKRRKSSK